MPSIYQPRRPRASPLWQIVHHGWDDFLADYEQNHRKTLGPLRPGTIAAVESFLRCGDLAAGFTRFHCPDFIAAAIDHLPPKGQQTVRFYGVYSNKSRGMTPPGRATIVDLPRKEETTKPSGKPIQILLIPAPPRRRARDMCPLWRDLVLNVWGGDPLQCPCCKGTMKPVRTHLRPGEIEFFLRLYGLWEGVIKLPRPPLITPSAHLTQKANSWQQQSPSRAHHKKTRPQ